MTIDHDACESCDSSNHGFGLSRRAMLKATTAGFGYLAFQALFAGEARAMAPQDATDPLAPKAPHFPPRAKHVIYLCMRGAPSHVDTFDYKPKLFQDGGKDTPDGNRRGYSKLLAPPWKFKRHGRSGLWISELFPETAAHADELCLLRGMHTDVPAHAPAFVQMHTGSFQFTRPSVGAWALYGLGTENRNLPGFITIKPTTANGGARNYGSAFLPAIYQGTRLGAEGRPVEQAELENVENPRWSAKRQRAQLDLIQALNRDRLKRDKKNADVEGVIESYELAFRMQGDVPGVMDISKESAATKKLYGIDEAGTDDFGRQCLLARRLIEAGVRFVEVSAGQWDQHRDLKNGHERNARAVDRPIAGLIADLKQRGTLKDTLILWGGEFGRTPGAQNADGRDHNHKGFTMWMAGGGVKGGMSYGATDDYGFEAVDQKLHVHDLHATILHLLGLDHTRLTYKYAGRDFRLTETSGTVAQGILA